MVLLTEVLIAGQDAASYLVNWSVKLETDSVSRNYANILLLGNALTELSISINDSVTITRGTTTATDHNVFTGFITDVVEQDSGGLLVKCRDPLFRGSAKYITRSYDINIDTEAGVISEIFSDIITQDLSLTPAVISSGTVNTIDRFVCNDDIIIERLEALEKILDWQFYYNFVDDTVVFEPKGNTTFATTLNVGTNIINVPTWDESTEGMFNQITVKGATSLGVQTESFSGDTIETSFDLNDEPENTKVTVGGVELLRGIPGSTSAFDYSIDKELKKLNFISAPASGTDNIIIEYSYKIPMPVRSKNQASIDANGLYESILSLDDTKTTDDAQLRVQKLLDAFSEPFLTTQLQVVDIYDLYPGFLVTIVDSLTNKNISAIVKNVTYQWPEGFDIVTVGTRRFDMQDFVTDVQKRIKELERRDLVNTTILNQLFVFDTLVEQFTYTTIEKASPDVDTLYWDDNNQGDWDDYDWGDDTTETQTISQRIWTNNIAVEDFADEDLIDATSTATVTTGVDGTQSADFTAGQTLISDTLQKSKTALTKATPIVTIDSGSAQIELTNNGGKTWNVIANNTELTFPAYDFSATDYLLKSDGGKILQSNGFGLLLSQSGAEKILDYRITEDGASTASISYIEIKHT